MTPYDVDWLPDALQALADLWVQAADRQAVTDAQAEIDRTLAQDPLSTGHPLPEGLYRLVVPPLAVLYSVDQTRRHVAVEAVWPIP
jgi:hypothetical protein